jgi:hypothetical protein
MLFLGEDRFVGIVMERFGDSGERRHQQIDHGIRSAGSTRVGADRVVGLRISGQ